MNRYTLALWVIGGLMVVLGVVFNNGATSLEAASLVQGHLGSNLLVGGLIVWALALHAGAVEMRRSRKHHADSPDVARSDHG